MKLLAGGPAPREERPASAVLHDEPNARVVAFHLRPSQEVPSHHSTSTVLLHVVAGSGRFIGDGADMVLGPGDSVVYAPGESHAICAGDETLRFIAVITPRPGG